MVIVDLQYGFVLEDRKRPAAFYPQIDAADKISSWFLCLDNDAKPL
jgi:hypothetical protein